MTRLPNKQVGFLYEANGYKDIRFLTFSIDWLKESEPLKKEDYYTAPLKDWHTDIAKEVVVDKEKGQYLGQVSTCMLADNKTILAVYPKGHSRGGIIYKRSTAGGKTWSKRLPTPKSWETSMNVPSVYRMVDKFNKERIFVFTGLNPARMSFSEDQGNSWSELNPVGIWGGDVVMSTLVLTSYGHWIAGESPYILSKRFQLDELDKKK